MRSIGFASILALLALVPLGVGSPTRGTESFVGQVVGADGWTDTRHYRGGERASVLVIGDHKEVPQLEVTVYDAKGAVVATDKTSNRLVSDMVGVVWFPPRDGDYRIVVRNPDSPNKCYIAIK